MKTFWISLLVVLFIVAGIALSSIMQWYAVSHVLFVALLGGAIALWRSRSNYRWVGGAFLWLVIGGIVLLLLYVGMQSPQLGRFILFFTPVVALLFLLPRWLRRRY